MTKTMATLKPSHFLWRMDGAVAVIQLNRPERKNPLTFESYAELRDTFRDLLYADDVHAVVFLPNGGNFCSGGDVHEIIGPLVAMDDKAVARLHAHDRRSGQGHAPLRQADHRRGRRRRGRRRRHHRHGLGHAPRDAGGADRVPVQPRRPCRLRHGRVRDPAAHHRPGPRRGAALHRPHHDGAGRRALGLLQQAGRRRRAGAGGADARAAHRGGPDLRQRHHQDAAHRRMVDEPRSGHRGRSAGAGDLHADQGFRARLSGVRRQAEAGVRGQLVADKTFLTWPFFNDRHRALADGIEHWCAANLPADHGDVDAACRDLVQKLGRDGWLAHTAPDPDAPAPLDVRTLCLIRETLARHDGFADFAFAMQGLGAGPSACSAMPSSATGSSARAAAARSPRSR